MATQPVRSSKGIKAVLKKLDDAVASEKYYEAHQLYRTLYFRYLSLKEYNELMQLLLRGAYVLLQKDQQASGADLAILLVDVLNRSDVKADSFWISALVDLFKLMKNTIPEREKFLATSTLWSMNGRQHGHPEWHKAIAEVYWQEKNYKTAHLHYGLCEDAPLYAKRLFELQYQFYQKELDVFIAKVTLQFLASRNYRMAESVYYEYVSKHPNLKNLSGPPFNQYPLLNFIFYLLEAVHSGNANQYIRLRETYAKELERDADLSKYLDKINVIWFAIRATVDRQQAAPSGLLSGLFRSLLDADSSDEDRPQTTGAVAPMRHQTYNPPQQSKPPQRVPEIPELD